MCGLENESDAFVETIWVRFRFLWFWPQPALAQSLFTGLQCSSFLPALQAISVKDSLDELSDVDSETMSSTQVRSSEITGRETEAPKLLGSRVPSGGASQAGVPSLALSAFGKNIHFCEHSAQ